MDRKARPGVKAFLSGRQAPFEISGKTELYRSIANGFGIFEGPITMDFHIVFIPASAGSFKSSNITSLILLWLVVLMADGLDMSVTFSFL
jgi:hypothetical protein